MPVTTPHELPPPSAVVRIVSTWVVHSTMGGRYPPGQTSATGLPKSDTRERVMQTAGHWMPCDLPFPCRGGRI